MKLFDVKTWNIKTILKETAIMVLMVLVISNVLSYIRKPDLTDSHLPMIKKEMIDGRVFDMKQVEGKPLLIHFWATWCPTCKAEADNIERLSEYYEVLTFAVKSGDSDELMDYMKGRGFKYRVINDSDGKWASMYNIEGYPTTFIYDRSGQVSFTEVGYSSTLGLALRMWWTGL